MIPIQNDLRSMAERKARYGHKDWLYWVTKDGEKHASEKTAESLQQILTDIKNHKKGEGWFLLIGQSDGMGMFLDEDIVQKMIKNYQYGI